MPLNWYSSMKKKLRKIRILFDVENWLWKSEIDIFQSLDLELDLDLTKIYAIFHSIMLPFDAEVDEKFLNVIYCCYIIKAGLDLNFIVVRTEIYTLDL